MLLSEDGRAIPVELSGEGPLPEYGARIAVAGRPQTDLFQIKLAAASYRPLADDGKFPAPRTTHLDKVFIYDGGQTFYHAECNGSLVSLEGKAINLPNSLSSPGVMLVDCGRFVVPVDAGTHRQALDGLELGCVVRVTGVCVLEGSVWSTENVLPRIESFRVVVRNADDVVVLARPPWWTPLRMGLAIGVLLAVVAAVLVWNRALNRLAVRRGRKLLREQIGRERATLRLGERTRLAVELHDSLSQCLGGLACQLAASKSIAVSSPEKALACLDAAERMLQSSRTELQRCIFDLRDDTLDDADFSRAIRRAVAPCSGEAAVDVRFAGGRSHISDSAAHAILCIIRELVSNAARHGRAAKITVVGDNDGRMASFSVRDDGCGFDVSAQSGPAGGHFGLEGIRERVKRQGGSFKIDSAPGRGTTAFVEINLQANGEETE